MLLLIKHFMRATALLLLLITSSILNAQTNISSTIKKPVEIGFNLGNALDDLGGFTSGIDARFTPVSSKNISWTITPGFTYFNKRNEGFILLKSGVKIPLSSDWYFSGEAGVGIYTQGGETFILSPGFGTSLKKTDLSIRYERYSSYASQVALRLGILL